MDDRQLSVRAYPAHSISFASSWWTGDVDVPYRLCAGVERTVRVGAVVVVDEVDSLKGPSWAPTWFACGSFALGRAYCVPLVLMDIQPRRHEHDSGRRWIAGRRSVVFWGLYK
jgi:hypothetical protein